MCTNISDFISSVWNRASSWRVRDHNYEFYPHEWQDDVASVLWAGVLINLVEDTGSIRAPTGVVFTRDV
jgi:hypothetical protein